MAVLQAYLNCLDFTNSQERANVFYVSEQSIDREQFYVNVLSNEIHKL